MIRDARVKLSAPGPGMLIAATRFMSSMKQMVREAASDLDLDAPPARRADVGTAMTDGESLYYDPTFATELEHDAGPDALRFVAAPELGHMINRRPPGRGDELSADRIAGRSLARAGADLEAIMQAFGHLATSDRGPHPSNPLREAAAEQAYREERGRRTL